MPQKLKLGDKVVSRDIHGEVVSPGPYGDQPFQIKASDGRFFSFINYDGSSPYNERIWILDPKRND